MIILKLLAENLAFVFQVHTRINYLTETINSLSQASGIENVLLIFSHDYYDVRINDLVRSIDFCKTMDIYFPYSTQIFTDTFPGPSPDDCPQKITRAEWANNTCYLTTVRGKRPPFRKFVCFTPDTVLYAIFTIPRTARTTTLFRLHMIRCS